MVKKTLVLGASLKEKRYSYLAIHRLVDHGHSVLAVGLREGVVAGVNIQSTLSVMHDIDTITLYLNPQNQKQYYNTILSIKPKRVIFNPGTENPELYQLLRSEHIAIEVACTLVLLATNQY